MCQHDCRSLERRLRYLGSALVSLSVYFAQVQLRIRQVASLEPGEAKERLLAELEQFAFRGLPQSRCESIPTSPASSVEELTTVCLPDRSRCDADCSTTSEGSPHMSAARGRYGQQVSNHIAEASKTYIQDSGRRSYKSRDSSSVGKLSSLQRFFGSRVTHSVSACSASKPPAVTSDEAKISLICFSLTSRHRHSSNFKMNSLKDTKAISHWGDSRAQLEIVVFEILEAFQKSEGLPLKSWVTSVVRKRLAPSLRDLLQHGLVGQASSRGGVLSLGKQSTANVHVWDLLMDYYHMKAGDEVCSSPVRTLSRSYGDDVLSDTAASERTRLLTVIGDICRSRADLCADRRFKWLVSAGLNAGRLHAWLRLVACCRRLVCSRYLPHAYLRATGGSDVVRSLARLSALPFRLPCDPKGNRLRRISHAF